MFESMMKSTNTETLKRIFRTDISSLSSSTTMRHSNQPRNMQTKANSNILGSINNTIPKFIIYEYTKFS